MNGTFETLADAVEVARSEGLVSDTITIDGKINIDHDVEIAVFLREFEEFLKKHGARYSGWIDA